MMVSKLIQLKKLEETPILQGDRPIESGCMEFHICRAARDFYAFDLGLFGSSGNVIFSNFWASKVFAKAMNEKNSLKKTINDPILPAQLNAMGLIDEILHYVAYLYREQKGKQLFQLCLSFIESQLGEKKTQQVLLTFSDFFPNLEVYQGKCSPEDFLAGSSNGVSHKEMILEEILMLWLANKNPAFGPYIELFDDHDLASKTAYQDFIVQLQQFFSQQPLFGPDNQSLVNMLRSPAVAVPYSLQGQLQYMKDHWGLLLGDYLKRILTSFDFMKEEERLFWKGGPFASQGYEASLSYSDIDSEPERFSSDLEWMPNVILLAKSTLVWLDQLSKKYARSIQKLDQIPDEELDSIARRGFNSLWLIGLWERSKASKTIKQMCGNPEAEASAYSLDDYEIANELGGWSALQNLKNRCRQRGIRLASDMVPNHTAMDSRWISEHPDRFLQVDRCPYPAYTFSGQDLSKDPNIEIKLEDHYYSRTDAAVVFLHHDKSNGRTRFIYHGNDGTSMPWNDTAQLDYLNPDTREAVIQVILHVARNFPIIRFDAAMTLAKKHIQRLWYPLPGSGGDIASRSEHSLSKKDFDNIMPVEFWREVVDRVAKEVPDTLLLAEAFWMMEGYFVRTLGMHRVYNSAFMHMFKNEDNEKYRYTIKNTLEFDPDILKRFVNFMNNPDEETAANQFGTGDKYIGVATMMVTMPGTPMFGHGQIEGYREKYGMEYRKAYWDEKDDQALIDRHEREIFPLMRIRRLFSQVDNFLLYDFWTPQGTVNQNVFAYSNGTEIEKALVFYNNHISKALGWVKTSAAYACKKSDGSKSLIQKDLAQALKLQDISSGYVILREQTTNLYYIRKNQDLIFGGLYVELEGFQHQVFLDIHEAFETKDFPIGKLCHELNGKGVPDIQEALKDLVYHTLYSAFYDFFNVPHFAELLKALTSDEAENYWKLQQEKITPLWSKIIEFTGGSSGLSATELSLESIRILQAIKSLLANKKICTVLCPELQLNNSYLYFIMVKALLHPLDQIPKDSDYFENWYLNRKIYTFFQSLGLDAAESKLWINLIPKLISTGNNFSTLSEIQQIGIFKTLIQESQIYSLLGIHDYQGKTYFNKENYEYLLRWLLISELLTVKENSNSRFLQQFEFWYKKAEEGHYLLDNLLQPSAVLPNVKTTVKKKLSVSLN